MQIRFILFYIFKRCYHVSSLNTDTLFYHVNNVISKPFVLYKKSNLKKTSVAKADWSKSCLLANMSWFVTGYWHEK